MLSAFMSPNADMIAAALSFEGDIHLAELSNDLATLRTFLRALRSRIPDNGGAANVRRDTFHPA